MASAPVVRPTRNVLSDNEWRPAGGASTLGVPAMLSSRNIQLSARAFWPRSWFWIDRITDRLLDLMHLPAGWDSYGAPAVKREAADRTLQLLINVLDEWSALPDLLATSDGGVLLEWFTPDQELRIDVSANGVPTMFYRGSGGTWEGDLDEGSPDVRELIFRITGS